MAPLEAFSHEGAGTPLSLLVVSLLKEASLGSEPTPLGGDEAQHASGKFHQSFSRVRLINRLVRGKDVWFLLE